MALTKVDAQLVSGAVTADSSGNVGIGTNSPTSKLDVTGTVRISSTSFTTPSSGKGIEAWYQPDSDKGIIGCYDRTGSAYKPFRTFGSQLEFDTGGTERMRIDTSGRLFVGSTSGPAGNGLINGIQTGTEAVYTSWKTGTASTTQILFGNSNGGIGTITTSGSSTAYNTSSDYRLKEDVKPMTGALSKVAQLKPVTYTWKADGSASEGFIAHELAEVCPEAVTGEKDAVDAEGNPVYQGIDTSFLVATLTAAIQELKAELDATKAEVDALKAGA